MLLEEWDDGLRKTLGKGHPCDLSAHVLCYLVTGEGCLLRVLPGSGIPTSAAGDRNLPPVGSRHLSQLPSPLDRSHPRHQADKESQEHGILAWSSDVAKWG